MEAPSRSRGIAVVFGALLASEYALPSVLHVPAYLVRTLLYDNPWGLENVVYAVDGFLPGGSLLWEVGLVITYLLFSIAVVGATRHLLILTRRRPAR